MKTHKRHFNKHADETMIFVTAATKAKGDDLVNKLKRDGHIIGLSQDLETLTEIGTDGLVQLYAEFFDLPSYYLPLLIEYFALWDKLRVCCGVQMSKNWRYELNPSTYDRKIEPHPYCGSVDIDSVEKTFTNTTFFKMIEADDLLRQINRPSDQDEDLDGSYCSRYNDLVRTKGLKFNQKK
jgi:hypothetical protein